ncbi:hypothetical protein [Actinomadura sp. DC4]|uniref:hypothetical protein n=1 Tax=Actinomadura sp. DC4 TaxID=3055069 RepID=UPI0025B209E3|nr:hypothetical protein [Actinomadura sp. DC4]MDN3351606.1 hypothetical protein [Actinomadura sp. DC4]
MSIGVSRPSRAQHAQLDRVAALAGNLPTPDRPEHHYRYDPAKADAYTATTLAWLGDPEAELYAREILARLETPVNGRRRARRSRPPGWTCLSLWSPPAGPRRRCKRRLRPLRAACSCRRTTGAPER